jgi:hypothetical protein
MLLLSQFICGRHRRDRTFFPAVLMIGLLLFLLQKSSGAWDAEFDGYPDEASHFVTGRMIWEYASHPAAGSPLVWAEQYYLHYPKVGLGHWPPGYYVTEALWSLPFGSSRMSAMWLQWFLGLAGLTGLYSLARPRYPLAVTSAVVLFAMASPVFQEGLEQTMAELGCLLCSVIMMHAGLRLCTRPDPGAYGAASLSIVAAILMKGTGVCFLPVPFLILLVRVKRSDGPTVPRLRWRGICILTFIGMGVVWHFGGKDIVYWGGFTLSMPWPILTPVGLLGWGFIGLCLLGLCREPLAKVAACMIASAALSSFALRAMREPRHWIIVLPAILLLSASAVTRLRPRWLGAIPAAAAVLLFPWSLYHQTSSGYRGLISQLHLPSRMLISSGRSALGEGGWIAEMSIAERYPASFVVRASKVLSESGWNGENYRLIASDRSAVEKVLDQLALDTVIVDRPDIAEPPHHLLLQDALANSPSWSICGRYENLLAWCRTQAPLFPRKPITIHAGGRQLVERLEISQ